jgi:hypothetical protein
VRAIPALALAAPPTKPAPAAFLESCRGYLPAAHSGRGGNRFADTVHGERILASAIVEKFVMRADGELAPVTAEPSRPIAPTQTHAGIAKVKRYSFDMP